MHGCTSAPLQMGAVEVQNEGQRELERDDKSSLLRGTQNCCYLHGHAFLSVTPPAHRGHALKYALDRAFAQQNKRILPQDQVFDIGSNKVSQNRRIPLHSYSGRKLHAVVSRHLTFYESICILPNRLPLKRAAQYRYRQISLVEESRRRFRSGIRTALDGAYALSSFS